MCVPALLCLFFLALRRSQYPNNHFRGNSSPAAVTLGGTMADMAPIRPIGMNESVSVSSLSRSPLSLSLARSIYLSRSLYRSLGCTLFTLC